MILHYSRQYAELSKQVPAACKTLDLEISHEINAIIEQYEND